MRPRHAASRIEDWIALRVRHADLPRGAAVEVRWRSDTTISDVTQAICRKLGVSGRPRMTLPSFNAEVPADAPASDCQLTRGMLVKLSASRRLSQLPHLRPDDELRLVHEAGPQAGFAWPFSSERPSFGLSVDLDSGAVALSAEEDAALTLRCDEHGTLDVASSDPQLRVRVDGADRGARVHVQVGSLVEVLADAEPSGDPAPASAPDVERVVLAWRLQSGREHESMRRVTHTVPYRVGSPDRIPVDVTAETFAIGPSPPDRPPTFDRTELALQMAPFAAMAVLLIVVRIGSPLYGVVVMLYPAFQVFQRVRRHRQEVAEHQAAWANWQKQTSAQLSALRRKAEQEAEYLRGLEPPTGALATLASKRARGLWGRRPRDAYFLHPAVGMGVYQTPSEVRVTGTLVDGDLADWRAHAAGERLVADVPVLSDLATSNLAVVGPLRRMHRVVGELLLRTALTHSPASLAMAVLLPAGARDLDDLDWLRWLPHLHVSTPLYAGARIRRGAEDCGEAIATATAALGDALAEDQHLLLVVHESSGVRIEALRDVLLRADGLVHVLWVGASSSRTPEFVRQRLQLSASDDVALLEPRVDPTVRPFDDAPDDFEAAAAALAPLTDEVESIVSASIPRLVDLGSVIDVGRGNVVEEILRSWRDTSSAKSLVASLGRTASGVFELDLVAEGPHLLLAGTTGSGKSELLRTLLVSLAMRYPPSDVAMVLVDFKGGAALYEFEGLPHVVGQVSNLESSDVDRLVAFLDAEISRRQGELRDVQGEYAAHREQAPHDTLPRLVVVIDEFQGFMGSRGTHLDAILNIAARGRSLGVHLLLSTQRPRGSVDPGITANVNARLCLRTLDEADSISVIDAADAAGIPRTLPGRCFARLEAGRLVELQTAFTRSTGLGARDAKAGVFVTEFHSVTPEGDSAEEGADDDAQRPETDMAFLLHHLKLAAATVPELSREQQPRLKPGLADRDDEEAPTDARGGSLVALGVRDEPEQQTQSDEVVDLHLGAVLLTGGTQLGKTSVLTSIGRQLAGREPAVELVVLDGGGGKLSANLRPHVAIAVSTDDPPDVNHVVDQLAAYMHPGAHGPVALLVDRLDEIQRVFRTPARAAAFARVVASGPARGTYVVATADPRVELDAALRGAFSRRYGFVPHARGMVQTIEEQLVKLYLPPHDGEDANGRGPAPPARRAFGYPADATEELLETRLGSIGFGVDEITHEPLGVSIGKGFLIAGVPRSGRTIALLSLTKRLAGLLQTMHPSFHAVPYLGPEDQSPPFDWLLDLRPALAGAIAAGRLVPYLEQLWAQEPRVVAIDGIDHFETLLPVTMANGALSYAAELADVIARLGVRILATSDFSAQGPLYTSHHFPSLHVSRRNFAILRPPPVDVVASLGFVGATFYEELVKPRDDREYLPGEGTLVTPTGSHHVRVLADPEVLRMRELRSAGAVEL